MGVRVTPNKRTLKNVYRTYIDVMNYVKSEKAASTWTKRSRRTCFNDCKYQAPQRLK
jgi:hypothetical protein